MEGRPLEESELVERARLGDVDAYGELVQRYREVAVRTAFVVAGLGADAEDAAQEALVKAFHALHRFRPGAPFRPWLLRIVANEALNRRRSANRRAVLSLRASRERPSGGAVPSPEEAVLADEERRALVAALNRMGERDRLVIAYRYLLGLSEEEIVASLGWARGTVKSRLSRAMRRLRALLAEETAPAGAVEGAERG